MAITSLQPRQRAGPALAVDRRTWLAPVLVLATIAASAGCPLLLQAFAPVEINYNEGWNAYRQLAASLGRPLYARPPGNSITNYPPLSFHIVGLLGRLCGDVVLAGRLTSLLALAAIALIAALIVRRTTGSRYAALCSGLCWLVWTELWTPDRIGVDDPQLLGMALAVAGFSVFLERGSSARALLGSALLFSVALFVKHNLLAMPLASGLTLLTLRAARPLLLWCVAGASACVALYLATLAVDGPYFLAHLLRPRMFSAEQALTWTGGYALVSLPILCWAAPWAWRARTPAERPLAYAWGFAWLEVAVFGGGDGVSDNILQELILMNAIVLPIALHRRLTRASAAVARAGPVVLVPIVLSLVLFAGRLPELWHEWRALPQEQRSDRAGIALLRQLPGPVACENLLMCFRAGRASAFDPYYVLDQIRIGRLSAARFDRLLREGRFGAIEIGAPDDPAPDGAGARLRFSAEFMQTLLQHYRTAIASPGFSIFVPRNGLGAGPAGPGAQAAQAPDGRKRDGRPPEGAASPGLSPRPPAA